jgi:hypothetical protein
VPTGVVQAEDSLAALLLAVARDTEQEFVRDLLVPQRFPRNLNLDDRFCIGQVEVDVRGLSGVDRRRVFAHKVVVEYVQQTFEQDLHIVFVRDKERLLAFAWLRPDARPAAGGRGRRTATAPTPSRPPRSGARVRALLRPLTTEAPCAAGDARPAQAGPTC